MVTGSLADSTGDPALPDPFHVVSIHSVAAPRGVHGEDWHRYEISQGSNTIVGYRSGTLERVREEVDLIVLGLNLRRNTNRGRVHVVLGKKETSHSRP